MSDTEIVCGSFEQAMGSTRGRQPEGVGCRCLLKPHEKDVPHVCDCGGSWIYNEDGKFVALSYPGGIVIDDPLEAILAALFGPM